MDDDQRLHCPTPMDIAENLAIVGVGFANAPTRILLPLIYSIPFV